MKVSTIALAVAMTLCTPFAYSADQEGDHGGHHANAGSTTKLHGTVNSVNAANGRVNISHDPVESLKWPAMKMNFKAHDPALLQDIKPGMTVDFEIEKMGNEYHVVSISPAK